MCLEVYRTRLHVRIPICGIGVVRFIVAFMGYIVSSCYLFCFSIFCQVGYIISAAHVAGPEVFTLAVEKAREEETEKEDGQLPELHGQDAPGRRRRGLRQHGAHDEELHAQDRELPHLRTMEP